MIYLESNESAHFDAWVTALRKTERRFTILSGDLNDREYREIIRDGSHFLSRPLHFQPHTKSYRRILARSLQARGIRVFPTEQMLDDYDDKLAQALRMMELELPTPHHSWAGRLGAAKELCRNAHYPVVSKLRSGASSTNVRLLTRASEAESLLEKLFSSGISPAHSLHSDAKRKLRSIHSFREVVAKVGRLDKTIRAGLAQRRVLSKERDMIFLQEFIGGQTEDVRVTVVFDRAYVFRRCVRPGDFRASGSGHINYELNNEAVDCVRLAFSAAKVLNTPMAAFDFVVDRERGPLIIEYSYTFDYTALRNTPCWITEKGEVITSDECPIEHFVTTWSAL